MYKIICLSFFFLLIINQDINAQKYTYYSADLAREKSKKHIYALKEGILIVRLESYEKQINQMKSILANQNLDPKKKEQIKSELKRYKEKRDREAKGIMKAFAEKFDYTSAYYTWDKDYTIEKQQGGNLKLLSSELRYAAEKLPQNKEYYILSSGLSHPLVKPEQNGWVIMNSDHLVLQKPFPYFTAEKGFGFFHSIAVIFGVKDDLLNYTKMFDKLNERLHKSYSKNKGLG